MSALVVCLLAAVCLFPELAAAQNIRLSTRKIRVWVVAGTGNPPRHTIRVNSRQPWQTESASGMVNLFIPVPASGTGSTDVSIAFQNWWIVTQPPGVYERVIEFVPTSGSGDSATLHVVLTVVPSLPLPAFSYIAGPTDCTKPADLQDAGVCTVNEMPWGTFAAPPVGATFVDPNFGASSRVLAGPPSTHAYSSPSAFSATSRYTLISAASTVRILDTSTGEIVRTPSGLPFNSGPVWDSYFDNYLYYLSGPRVLRYDVQTNTTSTLVDYTGTAYNLKALTSGATGDSSKDNWISFFDTSTKQICALSIFALRTYCADYGQITGGPYTPDFSTMAKGVDRPTGKRFVLMTAAPAMLLFSVNEAAGRLDLETLGPELPGSQGNLDGICSTGDRCLSTMHMDTFEDSKGAQHLLVGVESWSPCEYSIVSYRLNGLRDGSRTEVGGSMRYIMRLYRCGGVDTWADLHIGCAKKSSACVVSTSYTGHSVQINPSLPLKRTAHIGEIMVIRNNGAEVLRLSQHRSVPLAGEPYDSYWSRSRACISPDGTQVLSTSNFGEANQGRIVVTRTGF